MVFAKPKRQLENDLTSRNADNGDLLFSFQPSRQLCGELVQRPVITDEGVVTMSKPLISVVMSARNEEAYIADAIRSILSQTWSNFELIIIDDYSTDRTVQVCRSIRDSRIRLHSKVAEPTGLAASKNIGTSLAEGNYIAYQDADDCSTPTRLDRLLKESLKDPGRRIVSSWVEKVVRSRTTVFRPPTTHRAIVRGFHRAVKRGTFVSGAMMLPKSVANRFEYRTKFKYAQDWDHLARMSDSGEVEFVNIPEVLYRYFIRPKCSYMQHDWVAYNIFVRASMKRRRSGLPEWADIDEFHRYLQHHSVENAQWKMMAMLIATNAHLHGLGRHKFLGGTR